MTKVLVLGSTGAMATYLIPELLKKSYHVVGVSLENVVSNDKNLTCIKADAKDFNFLKSQLVDGFDAIVDFMNYNNVEEYKQYYKLFIKKTKHYIFLSSYRVYADDAPLSEKSKRLLDIDRPQGFITENEYSIYKAEEEDFINSSCWDNYTILRPAITYSKRRFQLVTLEAEVLIYRMLKGKVVVLPKSAMDKEATMTWAGDVAKMISTIILNPKAFRHTYNVSTSEHMKWKDIAKIYEEIGGLKYITVDDETYINILGFYFAKQQLLYDRCYNRIIDNSKILSLCNIKQEELMKIKDGLKREFDNLNPDDIPCLTGVNEKMDKYLESIGVK